MSGAPLLKGGLFWRRSIWNGSKCDPVILATDTSRLWLKNAAEETVFSVPCGEARVRFSKLNTMFITANGQKYAFVGAPAQLSKSFSSGQLEELRAAAELVSKAPDRSRMSGITVMGAGVRADAIFDAIGEFKDIARTIKPWKQVLPAVGVQT